MCTVAGTVNFEDQRVLDRMLGLMAHRGPDDSGVYRDANRKIFLGHRRLSIIDLSPAGHQPMASADGSIVVSFNGEIYNYKELAANLKKQGYVFSSASDTEVLVHGFAAYGVDVF